MFEKKNCAIAVYNRRGMDERMSAKSVRSQNSTAVMISIIHNIVNNVAAADENTKCTRSLHTVQRSGVVVRWGSP